MISNRNQLSKPDAVEILEKLSCLQKIDNTYMPFGDGHSAEKIVEAMEIYKEKHSEQFINS